MTYDYDRRSTRNSNEKLANTRLKTEDLEGSSVRVNTYQRDAYIGRKMHTVRRYYVVEWGLGRRHERSTEYDLKRDAMAFAVEKAESLKVIYAVGDVIEAHGRGTGREIRMHALVQDRVTKDGKPGWVGVLISSKDQTDPPGTAVWGFDESIKRRVGRG